VSEHHQGLSVADFGAFTAHRARSAVDDGFAFDQTNRVDRADGDAESALDAFGRIHTQFRFGFLRFRRRTPAAAQGASLEEYERSQARSIVDRHPGDAQNQTVVFSCSGLAKKRFIFHIQQTTG
jgi:hypothetical protein